MTKQAKLTDKLTARFDRAHFTPEQQKQLSAANKNIFKPVSFLARIRSLLSSIVSIRTSQKSSPVITPKTMDITSSTINSAQFHQESTPPTSTARSVPDSGRLLAEHPPTPLPTDSAISGTSPSKPNIR